MIIVRLLLIMCDHYDGMMETTPVPTSTSRLDTELEALIDLTSHVTVSCDSVAGGTGYCDHISHTDRKVSGSGHVGPG